MTSTGEQKSAPVRKPTLREQRENVDGQIAILVSMLFDKLRNVDFGGVISTYGREFGSTIAVNTNSLDSTTRIAEYKKIFARLFSAHFSKLDKSYAEAWANSDDGHAAFEKRFANVTGKELADAYDAEEIARELAEYQTARQ